jgi:hypothetical protein
VTKSKHKTVIYSNANESPGKQTDNDVYVPNARTDEKKLIKTKMSIGITNIQFSTLPMFRLSAALVVLNK